MPRIYGINCNDKIPFRKVSINTTRLTSMLSKKVVVVVKNQAPREKHPRLHWIAKHSHLKGRPDGIYQ